MSVLTMAAVGFPLVVFLLTIIAFYKLFIKKKNITPYYTPFDEITGQTPVVFHHEHEVIAEDEDQGDGKKGAHK